MSKLKDTRRLGGCGGGDEGWGKDVKRKGENEGRQGLFNAGGHTRLKGKKGEE